MTPDTATPPQEPTQSPEVNDDTPIIDTSAMSQGQADAMEVAEAARDQGNDRESFAGGIFLGRFDPSRLLPFPEQSNEDRAIGDELVEKVIAFLTKHMDPEKVDETRKIPKKVLNGLTDLGVFRMKVPKEYGGLGFSQINYNRVIMAIASYCGSTTVQISAHQSIGVPQPLKMFGTDEQKKKYLPRISKGALTAFALTEQDVGSDPAQMKTTAVLSDDGSHYILNGTKLWTTNGPTSELLVVMAQTKPKVIRGKERKQITAFIVETDSPGVEILHRCDFMGIRAIQNGVIQFTDVKVPVENLVLGEGKGLKLALKTLNTGRLTLPAACTGMAKQCLMIARLWGNQRVQWGLPVGKHEVGQEKIAYIASTTFAMEAVTWLTSHWADEGSDIRIEAAMAKLFCSEAAWKIVDMTMQFRGGRGYERAASLKARGEAAWPVERMMRDCRINTIIEGTSEIMRLFLAREALDPHLRIAADLLRPGVSTNQKLSCAGKVLGFYAKWYPMQWLGRCWGRSFYATGSTARHLRYIDRTSHRLAATMFHAMAMNGPKLEKRQVLLGHLMEIGTELFAMAAACAYGQHLATMNENGRDPRQPADVFCRQAKRRIAQHFKAARQANLRPEHAIAKKVLAGDLRWLEQGVFPVEGDA